MRYSRTLSVIIAVTMLIAACGGEADPPGGETPADPDTPTTTDIHVFAAPLPLPPPVGERQEEKLPNGTTRVWPNSAEVIESAPYRITVYTHCGFGPVDFDGSFWEVESGTVDPTEGLGDPEDHGEISLEGEKKALYISSTGKDVWLTRLEGPIDQEGCE